jgi:hypothetical protein
VRFITPVKLAAFIVALAIATCVNFGADVMGDQSDNAFPVGGGQTLTGIRQAARKPVDPQPTIGVEQHLNDVRIVQKTCDPSAERCAQHARRARSPLIHEMDCQRRPR